LTAKVSTAPAATRNRPAPIPIMTSALGECLDL
jgi:hypothetical protein